MSKLLIDANQREFISKQGYLPLSDLLRPQDLIDLNLAIDDHFSKLSQNRFRECDLWRSQEKIKKFATGKRLADFASEIVQKKVLRLAFDAVFDERKHAIGTLLPKIVSGTSFQEIFSIKGLELLFIFCLKKEEGSTYPLEIGEACVILPNSPFPGTCALPAPFTRGFMVGYGGQHCQYLYESNDPLQHYLKEIGYAWGDKLSDEFNPIVVR